ncbi:transposable element Tcb1 transposase [Trichonephila clavipes]|nr:transposable element Tcb1 transposase [Trichonephila clavipes]
MGHNEAGQSITDVALFFGVHQSNFTFMETIPNHTDNCPNARRRSPKGYNPTEYRYIAIVAKRNRRATSTRVTSMVTASIGKAISAATVRQRLHMKGPSTHGFTCRNFGGGDRGRVTIYRPFGELRRAKIVLSHVWCSRLTTGVPLAHATMNFVGLDLTTPDRDCVYGVRPAYSPDLNPIENLCEALGRAVSSRFPPPATLIELETALQEEWRLLNSAVVDLPIESMARSDEAHFWLNGYVNKQNCRIWSEANPQVYVETPLHPEKLTVWCALWAGGILLQKR